MIYAFIHRYTPNDSALGTHPKDIKYVLIQKYYFTQSLFVTQSVPYFVLAILATAQFDIYLLSYISITTFPLPLPSHSKQSTK